MIINTIISKIKKKGKIPIRFTTIRIVSSCLNKTDHARKSMMNSKTNPQNMIIIHIHMNVVIMGFASSSFLLLEHPQKFIDVESILVNMDATTNANAGHSVRRLNK
jgi:uncharacterized Zn-finger protein